MKNIYALFFVLFIFYSSLHAQKAAPVAVSDTVHMKAGQTVYAMVLMNDYDPDGDSIWVSQTSAPQHGQYANMQTYIRYTGINSFFGLDSIRYRITDGTSQSNWAWLFIVIEDCHCFDSVNVNNINAAGNPNGALFWDKVSKSYFEVPKGSGIKSCVMSSLNIAAKDPSGQIHAAGQRYEASGADYQAGPVADNYDSLYFIKWHRMWKVTRQQINTHISNWYIPGYITPEVIADWPAHGNTALGESFYLAPFVDFNQDGIYNPDAGDYPDVPGDICLYFIINDDTPQHFETPGGLHLKTEIQILMYEFECQQDSALWNTLFLNYKAINRSQTPYDSAWFGIFADFDIGNSDDDYMGCDVQRSTMFAFNGDSLDANNGVYLGYGIHPPALGLTLLKGPLLPADGMDNPAGMDDGINGFGYGDGITDNECMGMRYFLPVFRESVGYHAITDPETAAEYYLMLQGIWKDSTQMLFGGNGYYQDTATCGPVCRYAFPGDTDPLHWGTDYVSPNCNANDWTETTMHSQPFDRRGLMSVGPLTFNPGDTIRLDLAYVFGRDYLNLGNLAALPVMFQRIDSVRKYFNANETPCGLGFSNVPHLSKKPVIRVFPNPAQDYLQVEVVEGDAGANYIVFNLQGSAVLSGKNVNARSMSICIQSLKPGMYFLRLESGNSVYSAKFIKQ